MESLGANVRRPSYLISFLEWLADARSGDADEATAQTCRWGGRPVVAVEDGTGASDENSGFGIGVIVAIKVIAAIRAHRQ